MKQRNNKGLSLVELIVAIAIFAIAGIAICGFISFCSKNFSTANKNVKLQYDQQMVVNRVRDVVLETSRGISYDPGTHTLLVFSDNPNYDKTKTDEEFGRFLITSIVWNGTEATSTPVEGNPDSTSRFTLSSFPTQQNKLDDIKGITPASSALLTDTVNDFSADLSKVDEGKVTLKFTFQVGEKEITVTPVVSLRNMISTVTATTDVDDIYTGNITEFYSKVAKVEIERDGKVFAQAKTDTIAMDGKGTGANATSATYTATVTKKSTVSVDISTDVTWEIDLSSVKEGYGACISISGGKVTVQNEMSSDGKKILHTPDYYMSNGSYFVIRAISVEDPTKEARLRIKVSSDGVYPVKIKTLNVEGVETSPDKTVSKSCAAKDLTNGKLIYTFSHEITYTDKILDPVTNKKVNPLTGAGAYTKINYKVTNIAYKGNDDSKALAEVPKGAGFSDAGNVDGKFIVSKSMEEHWFTIQVSVTQKDKQGEEVFDTFVVKVDKDEVPDKEEFTIPMLTVSDVALRGDANVAAGSWSLGVPTYKDKGKDKSYYYWYEFEIVKDDDFKNWGNSEINRFNNLFFTSKLDDTSRNFDNLGQSIIKYQTNRSAMIYCNSYLDWKNPFQYRVNLRVKLSKDKNEKNARYYMKPGTDPNNKDNILTNNKNDAYVASKVVEIEPVTLTLTPAYYEVKDKNGKVTGKSFVEFWYNKELINATFNDSTTIGNGKKPKSNWTWDQAQQAKAYYKIFVPEYTGLSVNIYNYFRWDGTGNAGTIQNTFDKNGKQSALVVYYTENGKIVYDDNYDNVRNGFETGMVNEIVMKVNGKESRINQLYYYVKLIPGNWVTTGKLLDGCKWTCRLKDWKGNVVTAKFSQTKADYMNYTYVNKYEGEY